MTEYEANEVARKVVDGRGATIGELIGAFRSFLERDKELLSHRAVLLRLREWIKGTPLQEA